MLRSHIYLAMEKWHVDRKKLEVVSKLPVAFTFYIAMVHYIIFAIFPVNVSSSRFLISKK